MRLLRSIATSTELDLGLTNSLVAAVLADDPANAAALAVLRADGVLKVTRALELAAASMDAAATNDAEAG